MELLGKDAASVEEYLPLLYTKVMQINEGVALNESVITDVKLKASLLVQHYFAKRQKIINAHKTKLEKNLRELDATISIVLDIRDKFTKLI